MKLIIVAPDLDPRIGLKIGTMEVREDHRRFPDFFTCPVAVCLPTAPPKPASSTVADAMAGLSRLAEAAKNTAPLMGAGPQDGPRRRWFAGHRLLFHW